MEETYTDTDGTEKTRTVVKLTADNIRLEGLVTANENFRIKEDGSMEARNGTFDGYLRTRMKKVEESDAVWHQGMQYYMLNNDLNLRVDMPGSDSGATVLLRYAEKYIGSRVVLWNGCVPPYTRTIGSMRYSTVVCEGGLRIMGLAANAQSSDLVGWTDPLGVSWMNGIMELVGVPVEMYDEAADETYVVCGWSVVSFSAVRYEFVTEEND